MQYAEHEKLIKALEMKVKECPPVAGFAEPYFKSCWALIKKTGPAFKETNYPQRSIREAAYVRFQAAVEVLKDQQKQWENKSSQLQLDLLGLIEKARPTGFSMADLLDPKPEPEVAPAADGSPGIQLVSAHVRRKAELDECSAACEAALKTFMDAKSQLSHAHYKVVSEKLREVRQQIQKSWNDYRQESRASYEERKSKREENSVAWREKQEWFKNKLVDALANDEACLDSKKGALTSFQKLLPITTDEAQMKRIQVWITESEETIQELELNIQNIKAKLAEVEQQLEVGKSV